MALDVKYADVEALGQKKTEWERGVEKLVPDAAVRRYLQKRYGGALRGKPGEVDKSMVWQYGVGDTGKSTIQEAIAGQKGVFSEMSYQADAEVLTKKGAERGATDRFAAYVRGKRFAIISEIDQGAQLNQGKFKQMTGGESVQGTAKYSNEISYFFTASLFVSSNHTPSLPYGDTALSGRIHTVPFETKLIVQSKVSRDEWDATPVEKRADPGWLDRLLTDENERAAIFKWVLEGLVLLGREGLGELPEPIRRAMKQFADEGDPVARIVNSLIGKDDDTSFEQRVVILRDTEWGDRREADGVRELRMEELIKERARALGFADDFGEVSKKQVMAAKKMLHELGGLRKKTYYGTDSTGQKHTGMGFARCLEIDPVAPQAANGSTSAAYATLGI
jgi:phage/plasmid-associated DNA primase